MMQNKPYIIGVTGGIGSGKSTVAKLLSELLNAPLIDADILSRKASETDNVKEQIKKQISSDVFDENNILNRKELGNIIFNNDKMRIKLNDIIHPQVRNMFFDFVNKYSNEKFIIYDCPLLIEADLTGDVDHILLVYIDYNTQVQRILSRDCTTEEDAISRINAQMALNEKIKFSNTVIYNDDTLDNLKKSVEFVCMQMREICL